MLFDLTSDIHVSQWSGGIDSIAWSDVRNEDSRVLVLAGDLANNPYDSLEVVKRTAGVYEQVVFTDGNHEHYTWDGGISDLEDFFHAEALKIGNVSYMRGTSSLIMGDVVFVGGCGWYDFKAHEPEILAHISKTEWSQYGDCNHINFGKHKPETWAMLHATLIETTIAERRKEGFDNFVVVTHTAPRKELVGIKSTVSEKLDGAYCNTAMSTVIDNHQDVIKVWCYGHTHNRNYVTIDGVVYVNNARGYSSEKDHMGNWFLPQIDSNDQGY